MARPTRNNADYFTHYSGLRDDRRVKAIRTRFGVAGYGMLMMFYEVLADADYAQLSITETEKELLAGDFGVSVTEIDSLLQAAVKIGLFAVNEAGNIHSPDMDKWLEAVWAKRNRSRQVAETRQTPIPDAETEQKPTSDVVSVTETPQRREEKSKEEINNAGSDEPARPKASPKATKQATNLYPEAFEVFWKGYGKFSASKKEAFKEWNKLPEAEQQLATDKLMDYCTFFPEPVYRKDPERYLKHKTFENDFKSAPNTNHSPRGGVPPVAVITSYKTSVPD